MAQRSIIKIDEEKCNGCGQCVPNCAEGAIKIINGKACLVSDVLCDGLGACLGYCPQGALTIENRDAQDFDEKEVVMYQHCDCPGGKMMDFRNDQEISTAENIKAQSQLRQWPVQLHLVSPVAPYYQGADVLLCADCVAYALGNFHSDYLKGKSIAIACPKLDSGRDIYVQKIKSLIEEAKINTLTVMIMHVPCCMGLLELAKDALGEAKRKVPIKYVIVGLQGEVLKEEWYR